MTIQRPLLAIACSLFTLPAFAAPAQPPAFDGALQDAAVKVGRAFVVGKSVDEAWAPRDLETLAKTQPPAAQKLADFRVKVAGAKLVQQTQPPVAAQDFRRLIEAAARDIALSPADTAQAVAFYLRRLQGLAPLTPQQASAQAAASAAFLSNPRVSPGMRAAVSNRVSAMTRAFGNMNGPESLSGGVAINSSGRRMTPEELRRLNAMPATQVPASARQHAAAPPPPSPEARQRMALAEADRLIKENPGRVGEAYNYWDRVAKDEKSHWWITRMYAKVNKGLLTVSGLKDVEESAGKLGAVWDNKDVSSGQKTWMGAKLGGNAAMSFVTFLPAAGFAKSAASGVKAGVASNGLVKGTFTGLRDSFYWIKGSGSAVPGLAKATPQAAQAMNTARQGISTAIKEVIPAGEKISGRLPQMVDKLNKVGKAYGVEIVQGGVVGESTAQGGKIFVSLKAGAAHEGLHGVQQFTTRVMALEQRAVELGTTVDKLSQADRAVAFARAASFETASYAQFEAQAWRGTGLMGSFPGKQYAANLARDGVEIQRSMAAGEVLAGQFGAGARTYGRMTQVLGHSQWEIATGLGAASIGFMNYQKEELAPAADAAAESLFPGMVAPAQGR